MPRPALARRFDRAPRVAALIVCGIASVVLTGWILELDALKTIYGPITMKTNAALGLLLCGTALLLPGHGAVGYLRTGFAAAGAVIGMLTLTEHLFGVDLGIDQWLFTEVPGAAATTSPNRMGPHGSTSLLLAGAAILLLQRGTRRSIGVAQLLSSAGAAFALVAIAGYTYGAVELYGVARFTGIALQTALALLILHAGIVLEGRHGAIATLGDDGPAGALMRGLTLPIVLLPLLIGYVVLKGLGGALYDQGLAFALFAVAVIVLLMATVWHTAAAIAAADAARGRAHAAAERANRLKDQFIAVLSHELRTPLNVMLGRLQVLESAADDASRLRAAGIIARNGQLLARLVEDLLDLSRATSGQFELNTAPADLNALVRNTIEATAMDAAARSITVSSSLDEGIGLVRMDALRMQQVLSNVFSNALKFTPPGGRIDVHTVLGADVTIAIADTGVGFDPEFAPHLFEPFRQADSSTRREHGGLGLGLSIARHLIGLHGGSIHAESGGRGLGATLTITLPRALVVEAHRRAPAAAVAS